MQTLPHSYYGSRRAASNQELRDLATRLTEVACTHFDCVVRTFLELTEPDISTGVSEYAAAGANNVTAVPYFLEAGRYVANDNPDELDKARDRYRHLQIQQSDYLGKHQSIPDLQMIITMGQQDYNVEPRATGLHALDEVRP